MANKWIILHVVLAKHNLQASGRHKGFLGSQHVAKMVAESALILSSIFWGQHRSSKKPVIRKSHHMSRLGKAILLDTWKTEARLSFRERKKNSQEGCRLPGKANLKHPEVWCQPERVWYMCTKYFIWQVCVLFEILGNDGYFLMDECCIIASSVRTKFNVRKILVRVHIQVVNEGVSKKSTTNLAWSSYCSN